MGRWSSHSLAGTDITEQQANNLIDVVLGVAHHAGQHSKIGKQLAQAKGAAPPCAVGPYMDARAQLVLAEREVRTFVDAITNDEVKAKMRIILDFAKQQLADAPVITEYWVDAPEQWTNPGPDYVPAPRAFGFPRTERGKGTTQLKGTFDSISLTDVWNYGKWAVYAGGVLVVPGAAEHQTIYWGTVIVCDMAATLWQSMRAERPTAGTATAMLVNAFNGLSQHLNQTFKPAIYQQMKMLQRILTSFDTDPTVEEVKALMRVMNPYEASNPNYALQATWDGSFPEIFQTTEQEKTASDSWWLPVILGVLGGGIVVWLTQDGAR